MLRSQHNAWLHLAITILVCLAGWWLGVSAADWRWLIAAIALVWVAETMNTALSMFATWYRRNFTVLSPGPRILQRAPC